MCCDGSVFWNAYLSCKVHWEYSLLINFNIKSTKFHLLYLTIVFWKTLADMIGNISNSNGIKLIDDKLDNTKKKWK